MGGGRVATSQPPAAFGSDRRDGAEGGAGGSKVKVFFIGQSMYVGG